MGGGNGQKAKMARERNMEKLKGQKGSQLETNKKAMTIQRTACFSVVSARSHLSRGGLDLTCITASSRLAQ
ncbi:hypothetical protein SASPL_137167 [Salvia splendens]|uniref:Small EDRK-rich factor-like N-terminal domain-containing protein n=1 Tax=Salvia splendens TaxID=180675 RepID=A0A8X8WSY6_SALSN|nr:hypothetical protein SASPL_137167 [Salvia splendens]